MTFVDKAAVMALAFFCVVGTDGGIKNLDTSDPSLQTYLVDELNSIRRQASASNMLKMEWNPEAKAAAQRFANKCEFRFPTAHDEMESFRSTSAFSCGSSVLRGFGGFTWPDAMRAWYNQSGDFRISSPGRRDIRSYTAMVWATSYRFGCGHAKCSKTSAKQFDLFVCNYCPSGNLVTKLQKPFIQGTPCDKCPDSCDDGLCTNPCQFTNAYGNCDELFPHGCGEENQDVQPKCAATCKCKPLGLIYQEYH